MPDLWYPAVLIKVTGFGHAHVGFLLVPNISCSKRLFLLIQRNRHGLDYCLG